MFRSLSRCRTGMFILAGTLVATGLSARNTRDMRIQSAASHELIQVPEVADPGELGPSLDLQFELLYERLKAMGNRPEGLREPYESFKSALQAGQIDDSAIWLTVATMADVQVQAKAELVMRDFAARVLGGELGIPVAELDMSLRPMAWRQPIADAQFQVGGGLDDGQLRPKALCNTCTTPSIIANPTPACQYVSGNTTSACLSDFYQVTLTGGTSYEFTVCNTICPSATATWDTRIRIRQSGSCGILVDNDDFCGLQSRALFTPTTSGNYIIEFTAFTTQFGSYTMGYRELAASTCGSCAAPASTITPTNVCQTVSGTNATCPDPSCTSTVASGGVWYNVNVVMGRSYTFSTCPNNAAGGSCFGTASYDTRLDLWNSTCTTRIAGNDDITCVCCPTNWRSAFLYNATFTGVAKLQVRGFCGDTGTYTLAYQEQSGCVAAGITSVSPTSGSTNSTNCSVSQTFSVSLGALSTPPFSGTWSISAPGGSSAAPTSGAISFSGSTGTFTTNLTKAACANPANYTVNVSITNCSATPATATWTYQLRDTTAPVVTGCPAGMTLDCAAPDPPAPSRTATDNCDPAPTVTFAEVRVAGSCPGNFTTQRTWTARDCSNNIGTCTQNILHIDTTPPVVAGADEFCLAPPNHEYYCLQASSLSPSLTDDCSMPVTLVILGCVSNEPDEGTGDGDFPNDCVVSPDGKEVCLRSERAGSLNDRVYGILGVGIDACGNRSAPTPVALVTVPHDDSEHPECRRPNSGLDKHF